MTNLNKLPARVTFTHGKQIPKQSGLIKQQHGGFFHYSLQMDTHALEQYKLQVAKERTQRLVHEHVKMTVNPRKRLASKM